MKKAYSKPEIVFENFSLTTNIAGDCEEIYGFFARGTCGIPDSNGLGMKIFNTTPGVNSDCVIQGGDDTLYDGFCYHVPTETNNLFNS